jgi:hypothetical protein
MYLKHLAFPTVLVYVYVLSYCVYLRNNKALNFSRDTHAAAGLIKGETFWVNGGSDVKLVFPPIIIIIKGSLCWLITPARPIWKPPRQEQE